MGTSAVPAPPAGSRLAVAGDRVFDARAGAWADGTVVLVEDQVIAGITRSAPDGWPVLELPGTSLLPGLVDAHTHVLLRSSWNELELARQMVEENPGHRAASAVQAMSIALRHGFTTIRDLGSEGAGYADVGLRDAAREGLVPGPRMVVAGPAIRSIGRYPLPGQQRSMTFPVGIDSCTGPVACRETVRTQIAHGIDCLKIYVSERFDPPSAEEDYPDGPLVWTDEEVRALVDEAHRQGIRVAAHSLTLSGARMAVAAGVDSIEHGFGISPELAADMAARGTALVPTLLVTREHAAHGSHISDRVRAAHDRSFVNCLDAGVPIVLGTDVGGFEWTRVPQAEEFVLMTRLGMSPADALRAGTLRAAELLGLAGTTGVIEPGAAADIVAVAGDPLRDIECLQQVKLVIQGGRVAWDGHDLARDGRDARLTVGDNGPEFLEQRLATALKEGVESAPLTTSTSMAGLEGLLNRIAEVSPEVAAAAQSALDYERLVQGMASRLMSLPGMQQVSSGRPPLAILFETRWFPPGRSGSVEELTPAYMKARDLVAAEPGDETALVIATSSPLNGEALDFVATRPGLYHALVRGPGDEDSLKQAIDAALAGPPLA